MESVAAVAVVVSLFSPFNSFLGWSVARFCGVPIYPSIREGLRLRIPKPGGWIFAGIASWEGGGERGQVQPNPPARFHAKEGPAGRRLCYVTSRPARGFQIYDGDRAGGPLILGFMVRVAKGERDKPPQKNKTKNMGVALLLISI